MGLERFRCQAGRGARKRNTPVFLPYTECGRSPAEGHRGGAVPGTLAWGHLCSCRRRVSKQPARGVWSSGESAPYTTCALLPSA